MQTDDIVINIDMIPQEQEQTQNCDAQKKEIRNRFIVQIFSTTAVIGFCVYSIISDGKLPNKDSIIYMLLGGLGGLYLPAPKVFDKK